MLTGRAAFEGDDVSDTLAAVFEREPDWTRLPATRRRRFGRLLRRCLQKDPTAPASRHRRRAPRDRRRAGRAGPEARRRRALRAHRSGSRGWPRSGAIGVRWRRRWLGASSGGHPPPETARRGQHAAGRDRSRVVRDLARRAEDRLRRDRRGQPQLWLRSLDSRPARRCRDRGASYPFWSPDSRSIGFFAEGELKRIDFDGGSVRPLASPVGAGRHVEPRRHDPVRRTRRVPSFASPPTAATPVGDRDSAPAMPVTTFRTSCPTAVTFSITSSAVPRPAASTPANSTARRRDSCSTPTPRRSTPTGHLLFVRQGTLMRRVRRRHGSS